MARRVTDKDIRDMFEAYSLCGSYSAVAEATGWSVSTVRKYLTMDYKAPPLSTEQVTAAKEITVPSIEEIVRSLTGKQKLSTLTPEEKKEIKEIQKGMII